MKKTLTPEQAAARDARRAQFRAIVKRIADMPDHERAEFSARIGCVPTCEGRQLSPKNSMLVHLQIPAVSMVGGFRQWLRVGRAVKKGEHGATIFVPVGAKREEGAEDDASTAPDGSHFVTTTVFDVSQTQELEQEGAKAA